MRRASLTKVSVALIFLFAFTRGVLAQDTEINAEEAIYVKVVDDEGNVTYEIIEKEIEDSQNMLMIAGDVLPEETESFTEEALTPEMPVYVKAVDDEDRVNYEMIEEEIVDSQNMLGIDESTNTNPRVRDIRVIGASQPNDISTYFYIEMDLPTYIRDADGGTIRLIMQHERDRNDQVRVVDEHIATEFSDDTYGRRGRSPGIYGWTRQSGGGEKSWILGDNKQHTLADPWGWAWILDYPRNSFRVLGGNRIRVYSHPHVTTRVILMD